MNKRFISIQGFMNKDHLIYIWSTRMDSHPISSRKQNDDPEEQNINDRPDYCLQKENYKHSIIEFNDDLETRKSVKLRWIENWLVAEDIVRSYEEYYMVINTYGRVPNFFIKEFKNLYHSVEFKYYANFNRQVIINISHSDLQNFLANMNQIANYDNGWPEFINDTRFKAFKLIRDFHFYTLNERCIDLEYWENSFLLQFFQISAAKRDFIIKYLEWLGNTIVSLTSSIYKLEMKHDVSYLKIYAWVFSDIQKIQPSYLDVIVEPTWEITEFSEYTLSQENIWEPLIKVWVIDSWVSNNRSVLDKLLSVDDSRSYIDHFPFVDSLDHWTWVASLITFGNQIDQWENTLVPYANILSIKIISSDQCRFNVDLFIDIIESFYTNQWIKVFNLSVNLIEHKKDNENHSIITYIIDYYLAKYSDILFFISAWNVNATNLSSLKNTYHHSLNFKFDEWTNICTPADSSNGISIWSINGENIISEFSRKNCLDYWSSLTIKKNGPITKITTDIWTRSPFWFKPDFVERWETIKVLSSQFTEEVVKKNWTSFSSPLVCHYAVRLLSKYNWLWANSVKALLLNASNSNQIECLIDSTDWVNIPSVIVERNRLYRWNKKWSSTVVLDREIDFIRKRYIWHWKITLEKALYSTPNRINIIIQDTIKLNYENIYEINLPENLQNNILIWSWTVKIIWSLSYNHIPIFSDHLNYNPIHMAYRILACSEDQLKYITENIKRLEQELSTIVPEWSEEYETVLSQKETYEKMKERYVVKVEGVGWSHDNYYRNQYGNNQSRWNNNSIKKNTLQSKLENKLFIEVRCNLKTRDINTNIFQEIRDFIFYTQWLWVWSVEDVNRYLDQKFWFCLSIENNFEWADLYTSMLEANAWILIEANQYNNASVEVEIQPVVEQEISL
jgi:hypothetical protein